MRNRNMRQAAGGAVLAMLVLVSCTIPAAVPEPNGPAPTLTISVDSPAPSDLQDAASITATQNVSGAISSEPVVQTAIKHIERRASIYREWLNQVQLGPDAPLVHYKAYQVYIASESEPRYEFQLTTNLTPDSWRGFLAFMNDSGINLSEMLLVKMAHLLEIPLDTAAIHIQGTCFTYDAQVSKAGKLRESALETCVLMRTQEQAIPQTELDHLRLPAHGDVPVDLSSVALQRSAGYIQEYFDRLGARLVTVREESGYLQYVVRGLRGHVIEGSPLWEKLDIVLLLTENEEQLTLRLIVDGYVASGLREPRDTAYSDMGAAYYKQLSQFTEILLHQISSSLKEPDHP